MEGRMKEKDTTITTLEQVCGLLPYYCHCYTPCDITNHLDVAVYVKYAVSYLSSMVLCVGES